MFWRQSAGRASSSPVSANRVRFSFEISAWEKYPGRVKYGRLSWHRMGNSPMLDVRFELINRRKRGTPRKARSIRIASCTQSAQKPLLWRHFIGLGLRGVIFTGDATSLATIDVGANSHGNRRKCFCAIFISPNALCARRASLSLQVLTLSSLDYKIVWSYSTTAPKHGTQHPMSLLDDCDMERRSVLLFLGYRAPRASLERVPCC